MNYCHHCDKQVGENHKCKMSQARLIEVYLSKLRNDTLTKMDKVNLISMLESEAEKRKKKDLWGHRVILGLLSQIKGKGK